jgi:hypothetical protein
MILNIYSLSRAFCILIFIIEFCFKVFLSRAAVFLNKPRRLKCLVVSTEGGKDNSNEKVYF